MNFLSIVQAGAKAMTFHAAPDSYRADIPAEVNNFYTNVLLERAVPLFLHGLFAQKRSIPANSGSIVAKFRRYGALAVAGTLTDGVTPTGKSLSVTDITATAVQIGDFTRISDRVSIESPDPVLTEATEIFGEQKGDTEDQLARDVLVAGTTVQYASTAVSRVTVAAGMELTLDEVKEAVNTLKLANARKVTSISGASPGAGTIPIMAAFIGIVHPSVVNEVSTGLKKQTGWRWVSEYAPNTAILPGEIGMLDEVRFIESTNAKVFTGAGAASIDVYATLILGANAYGIVDVADSQNARMIYKGLGSAGSADPLDQRQTLGWKEYFITKILNDAFMVRIEHALV